MLGEGIVWRGGGWEQTVAARRLYRVACEEARPARHSVLREHAVDVAVAAVAAAVADAVGAIILHVARIAPHKLLALPKDADHGVGVRLPAAIGRGGADVRVVAVGVRVSAVAVALLVVPEQRLGACP